MMLDHVGRWGLHVLAPLRLMPQNLGRVSLHRAYDVFYDAAVYHDNAVHWRKQAGYQGSEVPEMTK